MSELNEFFSNVGGENPDFANEPKVPGRAVIRVIGIGGAGNNAVNRMIEAGITSAEYIAVNTDAQILACSKAPKRIQIGAKRTNGLGAGADPEIGREAAEESMEELSRAIDGTNLLFITAGLGGGTGTGAAPVIAKLAKDKKILTVAVVTKPFEFEGRYRMENALRGLQKLENLVDTIVIIPNEKISEVVPANTSMKEALSIADDVLRQGIRGIADTIVTPSDINVDFADVRTVLKDGGHAHMGVGIARGENRIVEAVKHAVNCPLLETSIVGATGVIINVVGGNDLSFNEARTAATLIQGVVDYKANIIFGSCIDENIHDEVEVTVIATGFSSGDKDAVQPAAEETAPMTPHQALYGYPQPPQPQPQPQVPVAPVVEAPAAPAAPITEPEPPQNNSVYTNAPRDPYAADKEMPVDPSEEDTQTHSALPTFVKRIFGKK